MREDLKGCDDAHCKGLGKICRDVMTHIVRDEGRFVGM